ncbi:protein zds1 [Acrodontium crateriforme]|uniref:Protein zds1 n=1 Tax=Acrodontium crateriforme TaxID=150365 RepID=A0AAQ3R859_9PEZI|nr:protein zds1 [Acrodontium crateriforme]
MQPSARQQELERLYNARKGHVPQISISDDTHHVTEAIGSYYDDEHGNLANPYSRRDARPLSYMNAPPEVMETSRSSKDRRQGSYFDVQNGQPRSPVKEKMTRTRSNDSASSPVEEGVVSALSPRSPSMHRTTSRGSVHGQASPPSLSRQSSDTAVQQFPLNDIDYESSPAAVAQELSNLQAIRRMSMNVDMADPDLPSFSGAFGAMPTVAPNHNDDTDDPSRLFWVPARLHPELAPKEFKTFVEERVEKIRRRSGGEDSLSPDSMERTGSNNSSLRRKKSMLSHQIDTKGNYEDGAERLERKRSSGIYRESNSTLADLESLVNDPAQVIQRVSADTIRRSEDSGIEVSAAEDMPILPPVSQSLKRSTRTTYRRGSLKKGERALFSKRSQQRYTDSDSEPPESPNRIPAIPGSDYFDREIPNLGLTRAQTEPIPPALQDESSQESRSSLRNGPGTSSSQSVDDLSSLQIRNERESSPPDLRDKEEEQTSPPPIPPQHHNRQFQSRLASGGRTTAHLPGYNNTNPLPHIIETLPDGTKVPVGSLVQQQQFPERRSSHEHSRPQRGGAHMRPVPGRQSDAPSSTLDDISSHPSPLPGSGNTRTDALTMVPTYEEKKGEKKETGRKSSWKWILGNDDDSKKSKDDSDPVKSKLSKLGKQPGDKARLDVLQNSIDGTAPLRGRESIVLNREDIKIEDDRAKKDSKKSSDSSRKDKDKEPGLLQAIFGGKKKTSESDLKEKKRKSDRRNSPDLLPRILKPDIDYNWTRFSILEERAIYRMAHIKLANPRRALYSQVLLSNFMYSYLAKVQMMHPQIQIPASQQKAAQQPSQSQQQGSSKQSEQQQSASYNQYQRYQEEQQRRQEEADAAEAAAREQQLQVQKQKQQRAPPQNNGKPKRSSLEILTGASVGGAAQQQQQHRPSYDQGEYDHGYDADDQHHYQDYDHHRRQSSDESYEQQYQMQQQQRYTSQSRNGDGGYYEHDRGRQSGAVAASSDYSVASTHDYLGHEKNSSSRRAFGSQNSLWDDEPAEELW